MARLIPVALAGLLAFCGCALAKPSRSERSGLLDRWAVLDRQAVAREGSGEVEEREPASRIAAVAVDPKPRKGIAARSVMLDWPLKQVSVTSPFGKRGHENHEGVDLKAATGTPVLAAQDGTVLYSGKKIRGYGRMVVLRHAGEMSTVYAHNSKLLVSAGQKVKRGAKIALSGQSGNATGPHLHFEVRDGTAAVDPVGVLPSLGSRTAMR